RRTLPVARRGRDAATDPVRPERSELRRSRPPRDHGTLSAGTHTTRKPWSLRLPAVVAVAAAPSGEFLVAAEVVEQRPPAARPAFRVIDHLPLLERVALVPLAV